jgi:uncharacterized protein
MQRPALIVFVKAPRPGAVKTRLAAAIGPEAACFAYQRLVRCVLGKLSCLPSIQLYISPPDCAVEIQAMAGERWEIHSQDEGDLGARMHGAFVRAFAQRWKPVVIIGSDCPDIEPADVMEAWQRLSSHDVVIGPARDGGYWLIGLREPQPGLFHGMSWSTSKVMEETIQRAASLGLSVHRLRELSDIDTHEDWLAWGNRAAGA